MIHYIIMITAKTNKGWNNNSFFAEHGITGSRSQLDDDYAFKK